MLARKTAYERERNSAYAQPQATPYQTQGTQTLHSPQKGISAKQKLSWLATIGICSLIAVFVLSQYALMTKKNYEIESLNSKIQTATTKNGSLQEQVIALSSPDRIIGIALNKLHMTFGSGNQGK
jgi:cell division protein FtsL